MSADVLLAAAIVGVPLAGATLTGIVRIAGRADALAPALGLVTASATAVLVALLWLWVPRPLFTRSPWIEPAGVGVGLYVDDLSLLFAVLVAGVSLLSLLYSVPYLPHEMEKTGAGSGQAAYYAYMLLFTGSMLGMVFAADLIQLYVFWELTGVASFLLIGLNWTDPEARAGAVKALAITALGGLAMLLGLLALGAVGSFSVPAVLQQGETLAASGLMSGVLVLLLLGAASKSAQFPFHVWLPDAMVAPTPVSAFLHSAALVAAGVYLLARFLPLFADFALWTWLVAGIGAASALVGGVLALKATRLKGLLAYSTISQYGFVFVLLGLATADALAAALFSFFQHGVIKAGLFFVAGIVTYVSGQTELGRAGGLWAKLPVTFLVAATLALSLGGLFPLAGFWMKEGLLGAALARQNLVLLVLVVAASVLTLAYMLRFAFGAFVHGDTPPVPAAVAPLAMLLAPALLALLTLVFGLWPGLAASTLVGPAAEAILGQPVSLDFSLHLAPKLFLSLLVLGLGAIAFATYRYWASLLWAVLRPEWSLDRLYTAAALALRAVGGTALDLQNGLLPMYIRLTWLGLLGLVGLSLVPLLPSLPLPTSGVTLFRRGPVDWAMALLLLLVAMGTVMTFVARRHVHIVLALSAVGYLIGGVFALEFAPDVGLVQVHVETLVTVLFVLALVLTPRSVRQPFVTGWRERVTPWKAGLAALSGLGSAWLSLLAIEHVAADPIAPWFNQHALPFAHAGDVVAAILVDFRALDTLGEITVFATAAAGIYALVRLIQGEPG